jgi:CopA family copper-resistance protein
VYRKDDHMNIVMTFLGRGVLVAATLASTTFVAHAQAYRLTVDSVEITLDGQVISGIGFNGGSPGPVLRFKEGDDALIEVTNNLDVQTSVHWHGLILPFRMDGVPTISYDGIAPGETFTYRFPVIQSGTYWYHSHSSFQEPDGAYGAIVIEPKGREPFRFNRDYVVQFADKHPDAGARVMRNLKLMSDYYNRKQQTVGDFFRDASARGFGAAMAERQAWGDMRMMRTDVEDVQGFVGLINGQSPDANWTGLFKPGERVRLRLVNSSAMTYFDVRIPGLKMTVVQADGNNIQPVTVSELRIAVAETYDVIVRPKEDRAYTIFAESMGRSGFARGTLAPRAGMQAEVPKLREPPLLTMADMGMTHAGMDHESMMAGAASPPSASNDTTGQTSGDGMTMPADSQMASDGGSSMATMDHSGHKMASMSASAGDRFYATGSGLVPSAADGGKFLSYSDLKAQKPLYEHRKATREIELRLTGNMERYIWSIDGVKYQDAEPLRLKYGERVRFKFVNETMMAHPMHLHGMWSIVDVGEGKWNPAKHVVSVAPGTTVFMETEVDAPGQWAFHCHLSYHAASGMFRKVVVEGGPEQTQRATSHLEAG